MSINQLNDEGAVIGYKPTLEYVKKGKSDVNAQDASNDSLSVSNDEIEYSKTLEGFSSNLPSSTLKNIDFAINNMKKLVDKLTLSFKSGNWGKYGEISSLLSAIENNDEEYIDDFINYHKDNIKGNIAPELIGIIYDAEQRMQILGETLKELYYGSSLLTTEEIEEIDKAYLKKIQSYEQGNDKAKINYLAISNDSILNKSVSMYAFSVNRQAIDIADVMSVSDKSSTDSSKSELIKKIFDETNEEIDFKKDSYNEQQNIEIMKNTLYNYYNKRQELIDMCELFNDNKESVLLGKKLDYYTEQINDAITNVNRTFAGNQHFLSEMVKLEREKHLLMNIYATVNYNSEN